jgi:hypothetical protein
MSASEIADVPMNLVKETATAPKVALSVIAIARLRPPLAVLVARNDIRNKDEGSILFFFDFSQLFFNQMHLKLPPYLLLRDQECIMPCLLP